MAIKASKLRRILGRKLGFEELARRKHECYAVIVDGEVVARTYMSRSKSDIDDGLLKLMAQELRVRLRDFKQAIDCTLDPDTFLELVLESSRQA